MLIAIGGLSGSGKSTLSRQLAPDIPGLVGAVTIRSDVSRKRLFGVAPEAPLPETAYTPDISQRVYRRLMRDAARTLRSGNSVILDATFIEGEKTASLETLAHRLGASFEGLWLSLDLATLQKRIINRGADASDATPAVAAAQWDNVRENPAWTKLDASLPPTNLAAEARRAIRL
jgi:predicted kinase